MLSIEPNGFSTDKISEHLMLLRGVPHTWRKFGVIVRDDGMIRTDRHRRMSRHCNQRIPRRTYSLRRSVISTDSWAAAMNCGSDRNARARATVRSFVREPAGVEYNSLSDQDRGVRRSSGVVILLECNGAIRDQVKQLAINL
jgi:hypothetical protein